MSDYFLVAISLLVSAGFTWFIAYMYYRRQGQDSKFYMSAERIGLTEVVPSCRDFGPDKVWAAELKNAKQVVEIMGYSMHETLNNEDFIAELRELMEKPKFQVRVLLVNPTSSIVKLRSYGLEIDSVRLAKRIYDSQQELSKIINPKSIVVDKREIRTFYDTIVPYSMIRIDNKMLIMPYMSSTGKKNSPILIIEGLERKLFKKYMEDFSQVWKKSQPLHNPRVRVPGMYVQISSEKYLIARSVGQRLCKTSIEQESFFNCLDIGCGDGTQSILTFNKLAQINNSVYVTSIDPSTFAIQAFEESLLTKKLSFAPRRPIVNRMWQEYSTDIKFHFVFCCHVLGAIYQQCGTDEEFKRQFQRMLSILEKDGQLCIVLASERSIELQLRKRERQISREILSAERFGTFLTQWGIQYEIEEVNSFLTLEGWLGRSNEEVSSEEKEVLHFLFSPFTDLTHKIAEPYRSGLRSNARKWIDLQDEEKERYIKNGDEHRKNGIKDDHLFVEMYHHCFWIIPKQNKG